MADKDYDDHYEEEEVMDYGGYDMDYEEEYVPPPRRRTILDDDDFKAEDIDVQSARDKVRSLTTAFLDDCDNIQKKSQNSDKRIIDPTDRMLGLKKPLPVTSGTPSRTYNVYTNRRRVAELGEEEDMPTSHLKSHLRGTTYYPNEKWSERAVYTDEEDDEGPRNSPRNSYRKKDSNEEKSRSARNSDVVRQKRMEIDQRLDGIMEFELPKDDYYRDMRMKLSGMNDRMAKHRILLDKYSGIEMGDEVPVEKRIEQKYSELVRRMPSLENPTRPHIRSNVETDLYYHSPKTTTGYSSNGITDASGEQTAEVRGRIRRLLCRSKNNPHYFRN